MAEYTINFVNGIAQNVKLPVGTYSFVSSTVKGYENGRVNTFTVTPETKNINLSITASGILNVNVEDEDGEAITDGTLQLSNQSGKTVYGNPVAISGGEATFTNVPYSDKVVQFYIKQNGSDETHDPIANPQVVNMAASPQEETIINNKKIGTLQVDIADRNYAGITPINGAITVTNAE